MQTFLPFENIRQSAKVLDRQRLGKQRVETLQILNVLLGVSKKAGWKNHPAVKMWRGHERQLIAYGQGICEEWIFRGYKDTCFGKITDLYPLTENTPMPPWLGNEEFHSSHRAALLYKNPEWYGQFGWKEEPRLDYVWPV